MELIPSTMFSHGIVADATAILLYFHAEKDEVDWKEVCISLVTNLCSQ